MPDGPFAAPPAPRPPDVPFEDTISYTIAKLVGSAIGVWVVGWMKRTLIEWWTTSDKGIGLFVGGLYTVVKFVRSLLFFCAASLTFFGTGPRIQAIVIGIMVLIYFKTLPGSCPDLTFE